MTAAHSGGQPGGQQLVLAGGGHSHALALRYWAMGHWPLPPATAVTLVSRSGASLYSGLIPAVLAGQVHPGACVIDLRRLCAAAGASFVQGEIIGLDLERRQLHLRSPLEPPSTPLRSLRWDWLSLDVGSVTAAPAGVTGLPVRPLESFLDWCNHLPAAVEVMGSGAAAVEVVLVLAARCRRRRQSCRLSLRTAPGGLRLGSAPLARRLERMVQAQGIAVRSMARHDPAAPDRATVLCTGSRAPAWLRDSGLPCDGRGRVLTHPTLVVQGRGRIFAAGDCGVMACAPRPAGGVWAVRAAPVLAGNLQAALRSRPLRSWRPQSHGLMLLGDGQGGAVAQRGRFWLGPHPWLWRWKQHLDHRFMAMVNGTNGAAAMAAAPGPRQAMAGSMACRGCAAKLPAQPLNNALTQLYGALPQPRDASVAARIAPDRLLLTSVDGFPALVSDPWLNGRLTTLHGASDLWASGACLEGIQALVTLPRCSAPLQQDLLAQCLAGVRATARQLGAELLGGHSLQALADPDSRQPLALQLSLGVSVHGRVQRCQRWGKGPLQPGDALVLSRPLGSGVIMAAAQAGGGVPAWVDQALATMATPQQWLVPLLQRHGCHACTDVTGFGLLGHLGEMIQASPSGIRIQLDPRRVPAYDGALELLRAGHASTLAPHNAAALELLAPQGVIQLRSDPDAARQALLIDPQTCGPLLAAVPAPQAPALLQAMAAGHPGGAVIGMVRG
ncbi:MAG: selenide, water dikinase SelD [Cyanobacteria bacterium MAG CAR4_bin_6]|nr:selenide, water dikinase SelD [Cyanobacteria bacterium MAG CAR4_bin_6]